MATTDFAQRYREYDGGLLLPLCQHCDEPIWPVHLRKSRGPREWHAECWWKAQGTWPPLRCFGCGIGITIGYGAPCGMGEKYCQACVERVSRYRHAQLA